MISGWAWEGTAAAAAACGVSDDEDRARLAAEAWLQANPGAVAVLDAARLAYGTSTLAECWARDGRPVRSRLLPDGRITWERVPAGTGLQRVRSGLAQWFFPRDRVSFLTRPVSQANPASTCGNAAEIS